MNIKKIIEALLIKLISIFQISKDHIFHEFFNPSFSNGIVIVSTTPGPQYMH